MTDINTVLAELKRGTDEILSEADLIEKIEMKKNAYLWGNRREVGVIICLFLEWLDDNYYQIPCQ